MRPLAGEAASVLFALGVIGLGFLAVPIMTTGAAYDLCQVMGWKSSMNARPSEAKKFYACIGVFTIIATREHRRDEPTRLDDDDRVFAATAGLVAIWFM